MPPMSKGDDFVDAVMRMLRARAEEGLIHITDPGVEAFIRDALYRLIELHRPKR